MQSRDPTVTRETAEEQIDEPVSEDTDSPEDSQDSEKTLDEIIEAYSK